MNQKLGVASRLIIILDILLEGFTLGLRGVRGSMVR